VPNALLAEGLEVMSAWGFIYKANIVWHKIRKDGGPDGRGVGFYFRNTTELVLFGVRDKNARTLAPGSKASETSLLLESENTPRSLMNSIRSSRLAPSVHLSSHLPAARDQGGKRGVARPTKATGLHGLRTRTIAPASWQPSEEISLPRRQMGGGRHTSERAFSEEGARSCRITGQHPGRGHRMRQPFAPLR
jgi:hypothetical protein